MLAMGLIRNFQVEKSCLKKRGERMFFFLNWGSDDDDDDDYDDDYDYDYDDDDDDDDDDDIFHEFPRNHIGFYPKKGQYQEIPMIKLEQAGEQGI